MIKNLLKVALRNLQRQKTFTLLHIVGLTLGLTSCLLISLYTIDEFSFDKFHEKGDRICRINQTFIWGDDDALFGSTGPAVLHAISAEVPEFESMVRVHTPGPMLITSVNEVGEPSIFEEESILAADSSFFSIFTFPLLHGNPQKALINPQSVVVTASMAKKYFGTDQVLGKKLEVGERNNYKSYQITGVARDIPHNSHIDFDFLLSMSSFPQVADRSDSWMWTTFVTFGLLRPDANPDLVAKKVAAVPGKYLDPFLQKYRGMTYEEFLATGEEWDLYIQPFLDIHLRSANVYSRLNEIGDIQTVYILCMIGGLILLISLINFVNLSTARATTRAKEVGIRKVIGSERRLLIYQFLTESLIFVTVSTIVALFLSELLLPAFNDTTEKFLSMSLLNSVPAIGIIILATAIIGVLSGIYPAFYLSSFKPVTVLKGKVVQGLKNGIVRNVLVTTQFVISIALIACTLIVNDQVSYWQNYDLGFDRKNKIIINNVHRLENSGEAFKNKLLSHPLISEVTYSSDTPPYIFDFDNFYMGGEENKRISVNYVTTDEEFIPVYGLALLYGRNFSRNFNDSLNTIVSVSLTQAFGFNNPENALNKDLQYGGVDFKIVGIIADINANLSDQMYPTALFAQNAPVYSDRNKEFTVSLVRKASGEELQNLLSTMENNWNMLNSIPFEYTFMDQEFTEIFRSTIRFNQLLQDFSILAIIVACLGMIGLIAFVIERRNKEIGIRKVLGATTTHILFMLSGSFGRPILIGFLIASPVSWYFMSKWLEDFPIRTSISIFTFVGAGLLMMLIAAITMSFQTIKAARINPVDYLKEE